LDFLSIFHWILLSVQDNILEIHQRVCERPANTFKCKGISANTIVKNPISRPASHIFSKPESHCCQTPSAAETDTKYLWGPSPTDICVAASNGQKLGKTLKKDV